MSQRWRVVDVSGTSTPIDVRPGRLVIDGDEIPLVDVSCILTGPDTRWSGSVVAMAAKYEVALLACDWRGVPIAYTLPWSSNTRVAARHIAQCDLSLPRKKNAWMRVVRAKILGQAANLPEPHASRLAELALQVRSGDPSNLEARAARMYWARLFADERFSRDTDGIGRNALLNYGYAVLRGVVLRSICVAGLMPGLAIFHRNRSNAFGLADDLIEPFRPAVDFVVRSLPPDTDLDDPLTRRALVAAISLPMRQSGMTVTSSITDLCQSYARYVEGDVDVLTVPTWTAAGG